MSDNKAMDMLEGHGLEKLAKSILDVLCDKYMTIDKLSFAVKEDRQMYDDNSEVNDFNIALMAGYLFAADQLDCTYIFDADVDGNDTGFYVVRKKQDSKPQEDDDNVVKY